jgi:membrane protein DedA with SNARE-associated domain
MTDAVVGLMRAFGYLGLFLVLIIENLFPPIPSEAVLPLAGFLVGRGEMNFVLAVLVSTAGATVGALILYALGRYGGRPLILRYGKILRVDAPSLDRAESWFLRYGDWVVLVARIIPLARSIVSIPAGTMRMSLPRFTLLTVIGTGAWNILLIGLGQLLGENWERVSEVAAAYSDVAVGLGGLAVVAYGVFYLFRRRIKSRRAAEVAD